MFITEQSYTAEAIDWAYWCAMTDATDALAAETTTLSWMDLDRAYCAL